MIVSAASSRSVPQRRVSLAIKPEDLGLGIRIRDGAGHGHPLLQAAFDLRPLLLAQRDLGLNLQCLH